MRSSLFHGMFVSALLLALGCTSNQELGDRDDSDAGIGDGDGDIDGDGDGDGTPGDNDKPSDVADGDEDVEDVEDVEHGSFTRFVIASSGLTVLEGESVRIGVASPQGGLGCALTSDNGATPGREAVVAAMHIEPEGDARCPAGVYPVVYDAEGCSFHSAFGALPDGCGVYKHWDKNGELVANLLARGGFVSITEQEESEMLTRCQVEVSLTFEGNHTVEDTFEYTFDPFGPTDSYCAH